MIAVIIQPCHVQGFSLLVVNIVQHGHLAEQLRGITYHRDNYFT
jgi:hypothetical protein